MRRRPVALIFPFAVLIAVSTLAFRQQHASLPTLGLADEVSDAASSAAVAHRPVFVIVLVTTQGREDIVRSGRPWRKVSCVRDAAVDGSPAIAISHDNRHAGCANVHLYK